MVAPGLSITPTFKYQDDKYNLNNSYNVVNANPNVGIGEEGLQESRSWSAGIDATYKINADTSITVGYMYENYYQLLYNCSCGGHGANLAVPTTSTAVQTSDNTYVNTVTAVLRWAAIPSKLDTELRYTASMGVDQVNLTPAPTAASGGQFPNYTTWFQRLDAEATYTFDKDWVSQLGWKGAIKAKLHYAWERNSMSNWANDPVAPYARPCKRIVRALHGPQQPELQRPNVVGIAGIQMVAAAGTTLPKGVFRMNANVKKVAIAATTAVVFAVISVAIVGNASADGMTKKSPTPGRTTTATISGLFRKLASPFWTLRRQGHGVLVSLLYARL